jgi:YfiH family protein
MTQVTTLFTTTKEGNVAYHVGDNIDHVNGHHEKLASSLNYDVKRLRYMNQVHGSHIEVVTFQSPKESLQCDALITQESNLPLMVMVADCIPVLMYDQNKGVIAAVHAGRNSTFERIVPKTVLKMQETFGCKAADIKVILGPSIQKCCYEVSAAMAKIVQTSFGESFVKERYIDLQGINVHLLEELGVQNIEVSEICTQCSGKPYYSYRLCKQTGRFCGLIIKKDI